MEENKFGGFRGREREEEREGWGDDRRREGFYQHEDRERRGEGRDARDGRGGIQDRHNNRGRRRQNEPEWMSECVSKSDVIELRGFDERKEVTKEPSPPAALPISLSLGLTKAGQGGAPPGLPAGSISVEDLEREQRDTKQQQHRERENNNQQVREKNQNNHQREMNHNRERENNRQNGQNNLDILKNLGMGHKNTEEKSFNYDQIIESMNLSSLLGGAPGLPDPQAHVKPAAQSRFSQFFNRGGGEQQGQDSRRSSIQDELLGANILKEINGEEGPVIRIPSPAADERYFAPISPAAQTRAITNPLLDMINKGTNQQGHHRVQDLEEGIRRSLGLGGPSGQHQLPPHQQLQNQQAQDIFKAVQGHNMNNNMGSHIGNRQFQGKENREQHEQQQDSLSAFKKLVAQVGPQHQPEPRDESVPFGPGVVRPSPLPASIPTNAPTEQEILEHMMSGGMPGMPGMNMPRPEVPSLPPALANYLASHPLNTELLARPEAKQLLVGLNSGNITVENILQQLSNPALQLRQRDLLLSVLKLKTMTNHGRTGSGLPPPIPPHLAMPRTSPLPPNDPMMLLPQGAPPTRVSPLMFPHLAPPTHLSVSPSPQTARVPSPQEMTVLTQQIMQQALIKRKLEEQKENFRRRQGDVEPTPLLPPGSVTSVMPQSVAAVSSSMVTSGSPLAFTPTSVMRKNAAERKDSDPLPRGAGGSSVPEVKVTPQKEGVREGGQLQPPASPGRAITKSKEERDRPASLELGPAPGGRRLSPQQIPSHAMFPPHLPHNNPLLYLQNNPMGHVSHSMLSQANAMAQQQMAAANLLAHGLDPRQVGNCLPPQHLPRPQCVSPNRSRPNMAPSPQPQGALARFFSPEVLAQAQSGAVPAMPPMASLTNIHQQNKVLTLEEIERQAAAVRI